MDTHSYADVSYEWLEDSSFTVSYSLEEEEGWVSFHDYIPDYSFCLRNNTLLQFYNGQMYQMNVGYFGVYFGQRFVSSITPVFCRLLNDQEKIRYPFMINYLNWNTDIEDALVRRFNETWDSISLHNSFQGTRQTDLILYKDNCSLLENYGVFNTKRTKNHWHFNKVFNEKSSIYSRTWLEVRDRFIVTNVENKDCTDEELYRTKFFDDFVIVKLIFNNVDNRRLFHYDIFANISVDTQ